MMCSDKAALALGFQLFGAAAGQKFQIRMELFLHPAAYDNAELRILELSWQPEDEAGLALDFFVISLRCGGCWRLTLQLSHSRTQLHLNRETS